MDSVTNTKHTPSSPSPNTPTSEPKFDSGQFERQIKLLSERKDAIKKELTVLDRQERSGDRSKPCSQNHSSGQSDCRSPSQKKKILNEEIGVLNKEMKVLNEELKLVNHSKPGDRGQSFHEKMKILNEETRVLNNEMKVLNEELKLITNSKPHGRGKPFREKMKILNQEIHALNEELNALNKELEALNRRRIS